MGFMQKQIVYQSWYLVETTNGTECMPSDLCDSDLESVADYCEGTPQSVEEVTGFGARLSAPGYMDCTEWTIFGTLACAEEYLESLDECEDEDEEQADEYTEGR